ncbi:hypothetical protein BZG36_05075 [Bifiguratus adelaidae]|uniref:DNA repair protein rad9 n=1 Tax=Bifiguratus adelaidae TaxID=1938954 RepID=A0A261XTX6_9FUNG|nr:hypothetical protein BZG36_05075 [Bifiguratus adelaidae]
MSFTAIISAKNLRAFSKAVTCLEKLNEECIIEARHERFQLTATEASRIATATQSFQPAFFEKYKVNTQSVRPGESGSEFVKGRVRTTSQTLFGVSQSHHASFGQDANSQREYVTGGVNVKVSLKQIIRERSTIAIERCELRWVPGHLLSDTTRRNVLTQSNLHESPRMDADGNESDEESIETKLIIELHCAFGVTKTYKLPVTTSQRQHAIFDRLANESGFTVEAGLVADWISHFQKNIREMTITMEKNTMKIKANYDLVREDESDDRNGLNTEISLGLQDFTDYHVKFNVTQATFDFKVFKAVVGYAESLTLPISVYIDQPGRPIYFRIESGDTMVGDFILETAAESLPDLINSSNLASRANSVAPSQSRAPLETQPTTTPRLTREESLVPAATTHARPPYYEAANTSTTLPLESSFPGNSAHPTTTASRSNTQGSPAPQASAAKRPYSHVLNEDRSIGLSQEEQNDLEGMVLDLESRPDDLEVWNEDDTEDVIPGTPPSTEVNPIFTMSQQ